MTSQGLDRLDGKVAIVTGGASGFGAAIAQKFAEESCKVLIGDLNSSAATTTAQSLKSSNIKTLKMNVTEESHWKEAVSVCLATWGRLDIIVNNAGTTYKNKPSLSVTEAEFDTIFTVNVKSIFHSVRVCVPQLQSQGTGGSIINISSIGSVRPRPGLVWYNGTKGAVTNATKGLAAEFGPDQIRVNAIAPLLSGTGLFSAFAGVEDTKENREKLIANVPLGRLTEPMDVANAALFLASDEGRFITGVNLEVDGGRAV
ncbi:oxidoreductase [Patellaria atrata CBS 101060]|uniref:Oxidoreductase n=1 Tax=Patellaria atrata CBS 101060 TaxID=1346257 RepID=A0A9P4SKT9_9PEZI|nr:oxidoreductase [Patellaria atrata CBS 101060]